jgi:hypothetical protein
MMDAVVWLAAVAMCVCTLLHAPRTPLALLKKRSRSLQGAQKLGESLYVPSRKQ